MKEHDDHKLKEILPQEVKLNDSTSIGGSELFICAGPCSVESEKQLDDIAANLAGLPVQAIRGGAFKPRTNPHSFQGLGEVGLKYLQAIKVRYGLPIVTEVMCPTQVDLVGKYADLLQIGSRNMQNFPLLRAVGKLGKPVLLKRGLAATLDETMGAIEYIVAEGNRKIILCERGIRSFDPYSRNVLDLGGALMLKNMTGLPIIVDPSHAVGKREFVAALGRSAIAAGLDGLIVECHPDPESSISDARQALSIEAMIDLVEDVKGIAKVMGKNLQGTPFGAKKVLSR